MQKQNIEESVKEKLDFWRQNGKSGKINFSLDEYKIYLNNYSENDRKAYISLNISQKDLDSNNIESILLDVEKIGQIGFEFDSIINIDFNKLKNILIELKKNNSLSNGLEYIKYASSTVKEKDIETVENETIVFKEIISEVTEDMSDFEKFATIYRNLGKRISYDFENAGVGFHSLNEYLPQSNLEGIISGKSICGGYSLILKQALELVGIETKCRVGSCPTEGFHAWNQVNLDGVWYNTDLSVDAEKIAEEQLPFCLKSDDTFEREGYVDSGDMFMQGDEKENCPMDYSLDKLNEAFKDYIIKHYDFSIPTNISIENINGLYNIFINNLEENKIQFMRVISPEQMYNLFDVALDGRKLKSSENNQLKSRNVIVNMNIYDIEEYLQSDGFDLEDFIKASVIDAVKQHPHDKRCTTSEVLISSGVEAGLNVLRTESINNEVFNIVEHETKNRDVGKDNIVVDV